MYCNYCGSNKHSLKNCPKTWDGSINRKNMRCAYCGNKKHDINACSKTWGGRANITWHKDKIDDNYILD